MQSVLSVCVLCTVVQILLFSPVSLISLSATHTRMHTHSYSQVLKEVSIHSLSVQALTGAR